MIIDVSSKAPAEIVPVTFNFSKLVTLIDSAVITNTVVTGTDASSATMLLNAATITGATVTQLIRNGVDGNIYRIRAEIVSGSAKYAMAMDLPIKELS